MNPLPQIPRRGLSRTDILIILIMLAVTFVLSLAIAIPALHRARNGSAFLTCSTRINQTHKGWVLWSMDYQGRFPLPMEVSPETAMRGSQPGNSTANVHSLMIFNAFNTPQGVLCALEPSANVVEFRDYNYGDRRDGVFRPGDAWDTRFSADLTTRRGSNVSFANLALVGKRMETEWADSLNKDFPVVSERGHRDGRFDAKSITNRMHGARTAWNGNVGFNDGHVSGMSFVQGDPDAFLFKGDNFFRSDDAEKGADIWLGVFGPTTEKTATAYWD